MLSTTCTEDQNIEDRSFIFLLYLNGILPHNDFNCDSDAKDSTDHNEDGSVCGDRVVTQRELEPIRVPFRSVVIGLLANQILLQTIGIVLVQGSKYIIPSLANVLMQPSDMDRAKNGENTGKRNRNEDNLPGFLANLKTSHILSLLSILELSYASSVQFDSRPGLKFLIQKVAVCEKAANLYRQAGASWTISAVTSLHLILNSSLKKGYSVDHVKSLLSQENKNSSAVASNASFASSEDVFYDPKENTGSEDDLTDKEAYKKAVRPSTLNTSENGALFVQFLSHSFMNLCNVYLGLLNNKEDRKHEIDDYDCQPLFFLSVKADEFPTDHRRTVDLWTRKMSVFNKKIMEGKKFGNMVASASRAEERQVTDDNGDKFEDSEHDEHTGDEERKDGFPEDDSQPAESADEEVKEEEEKDGDSEASTDGNRKPFMLADFAKQYSTDSDSNDSSLPDLWKAEEENTEDGVNPSIGESFGHTNCE